MTNYCILLPDSRVDILAEISRAFEGQPSIAETPPVWVLVVGGVAAGKTTIRREKYTRGYVTIDAAEIFIRLCQGRYVDFPPPPSEKTLAEALELIGYGTALRAVRERGNVVTELIGAEYDHTKGLMDAIVGAGYRCEYLAVTCELNESLRRSSARGQDNISAFYTEPFHRRWILTALDACSTK